MAGAILILALAAATNAEQTLLLAVVVNDYPTGKIGEFTLHEGKLFARGEELRELGFRPPANASTYENLVELDGLTDFSYRIDQRAAMLYVTAGMNRLQPAMLGTTASPDRNVTIQSGTGVTLDYDLIGTSVDNRQFASGSFDVRAFSPWGVLSSTGLLADIGGNGYGTDNSGAIRLDSKYEYSDPETLRRYSAGDFINGSLPWTRAVRLGGIQINSDFSMRPDLITFPVPSLAGSAAVPSTVDVLVNGNRVLSQQIQPGAFQIPQLPVITGSSTVSMTVTNALGQQVVTELPFYASPSLLAPGLQTWSIEAGMVRRNWGIVSDDYGDFAGSMTYRRGWLSDLTLEAHAEESRGVFMAGLGGVMNLANLAVANLAIAGSTGSGFSGAQLSAGIQHIGPRFSLGASATLATHDFGDIAAANGDPIVQLLLNANAGVSLGRFGSLGIAYVGVDRASSPQFVATPPLISLTRGPEAPFIQPAVRSQILSASYSTQLDNFWPGFGRTSFYATAYRDFANPKDMGLSVGLVVPLGTRSSAGVNAQSQTGEQFAQLQVQQTAVNVGDWGYQAFASADHQDVGQPELSDHEFGQASYKSPWGMVSLGVDHLANQTTLQGEVQGAVSFVDGLFLSNRINDSFAIVDTNGFAGIAVQQENRYAGTTDSSGKVLVPDLRSFEINHISIDPLDAPADADIPFDKREVRPQDRSGVVVEFPLKVIHGALLRLTDVDGRPIPVGSIATLLSTSASVPVGFDGETYVVGVQSHDQVRVELPDGRHCAANFDYHPMSGDIPAIGPLRCLETLEANQ